MDFWHLIGSLAAILTMFSFLPQIIKTYKSKSARDVSLVTLFQLSLGVTLWMIYGVYLKNMIIIVANAVTLTTLIVLVFFYFNYGRKSNEESVHHRN